MIHIASQELVVRHGRGISQVPQGKVESIGSKLVIQRLEVLNITLFQLLELYSPQTFSIQYDARWMMPMRLLNMAIWISETIMRSEKKY